MRIRRFNESVGDKDSVLIEDIFLSLKDEYTEYKYEFETTKTISFVEFSISPSDRPTETPKLDDVRNKVSRELELLDEVALAIDSLNSSDLIKRVELTAYEFNRIVIAIYRKIELKTNSEEVFVNDGGVLEIDVEFLNDYFQEFNVTPLGYDILSNGDIQVLEVSIASGVTLGSGAFVGLHDALMETGIVSSVELGISLLTITFRDMIHDIQIHD